MSNKKPKFSATRAVIWRASRYHKSFSAFTDEQLVTMHNRLADALDEHLQDYTIQYGEMMRAVCTLDRLWWALYDRNLVKM